MFSTGFSVLLCVLIYVFSVFAVTNYNPVWNVVCLIIVFLFASLLLALLGIYYASLTLLIIYIGAVAMLLLFVLFMLDLNVLEKAIYGNRTLIYDIPLTLFLGTCFFFLFSMLIPNNYTSDFLNVVLEPFSNDFEILEYTYYTSPDSVQQRNHLSSIGLSFYSMHAIWLLLCGIILLQSIMGTILLAGPTSSRQSHKR